MLPSFCRDAVTVRRAPLVQMRGTTARDWRAATAHTVPGCSLQPASTEGTWGDTRSGSTVRAVLYLPPGADVEHGDKIEFDGREYAMDGDPLTMRSPTGRVTHLVVNLVDWRG
jgi:hypothetical protein